MTKKNKKKSHTKFDLDNSRAKIITHFCNFLIIMLNDFVKKYFNYQRVKFRKINSGIKTQISKESISNLMKMNLEELCNQKISIKYKDFNSNQNSKSFLIFKHIHDNPLINLNLLNIFEKYYLNEEKIEIRNKKGDNVIINNTNNFKSLIKRQNESKYVNLLNKSSNKIKNIDIHNTRNTKTYVTNGNIDINEFEFSKYSINDIIDSNKIGEDYNYLLDNYNEPFI